jgi:hypothetical protein
MAHRRRRLTLAAVLAASMAPAAQAARWDGATPAYRTDEILVRYREQAAAPMAKAMRDTYGLRPLRTLARDRLELLELPSVLPLDQALTLLRSDPAVEGAEPNFLRRKLEAIPDDPLFGEQWGLKNTGQPNFVASGPPLASVVGADMDLPRAWDRDGDGVVDRTGDGSVTVAIIDDAFDLDHPDLQANFVSGRDTASNDGNPAPDNNSQSHGTLVTGALGAVGNNGVGVAGIAWNVKLLPLKVGRGSALDSAGILDAYDYVEENAASRGIRIVNASYGGPQFSNLELSALTRLRNLGVLFVTAAGNEDSNTDRAVRAYPANYELDNIVAVAATNRQDNISSFSQYGPLSVDLAAPGLQIVTTAFKDTWNFNTRNRSASGVSGTSFSSPYVAGIAALIAMEFPDADYREIKARLIEGAQATGDEGLTHRHTRSGRANAANSLELTSRPVLVLKSVVVDDSASGDGNGRLDPGETADLVVTAENLWAAATTVQATLAAPGSVTVIDGSDALATLAANGTAAMRFTVRAPSGTAYADIPFDVAFSAAGGYSATRSFSLEVAELSNAVPVSGVLSTGLYDEFHTYHLDLAGLPAGHNRLRIRSSTPAAVGSSAVDIDLLAKRGSAPQYLITLSVNPDGDQIFDTDATAIGGAEDGNEHVCFFNPTPGTYYVTVVNYSQLENTPYTLEAFTDVGSQCPPNTSSGRIGGSGGGSLPVTTLLGLLAMLGWRLRRGAAEPQRRRT